MKLFFGFLLSACAKDADLYCNSCMYRFNHQGNQVEGELACLDLKEGDTTFRSKCSVWPLQGQKLTCSTEFTADWLPDGQLDYTIKRGCKAVKIDTPADQASCPVEGASITGFYYRDCVVYCPGDICNADNRDQMFNLMAIKDENGVPRKPQKCRSCDSKLNPSTGVQCMMDPVDLPDGEVECPIYANAGCFSSNFYQNGRTQMTSHFYKGCSPFMFTDEAEKPDYTTRCVNTQESQPNNPILTHTCKETCDTDGCNDGVVTEDNDSHEATCQCSCSIKC